MKRLTALLLVLFVSAAALSRNAAHAQGTSGEIKGVKYTFTTSNQGPKAKLSDVITFSFIAKTDKDSVLQNSYEMGHPVKVQVMPSGDIVDLMDIFVLMAANDVIEAKIPTDSIFKGIENQRPAYFPKGSFLNYTIKMEKIQTLQEALDERDKAIKEKLAAEKDTLEKYIVKNKITVTSTPTGLKYRINKPSSKPKPVAGDTVFVNYVGRTLDGKVFDSSIAAEAAKAGLQQPGRVYEPIDFVVGEGAVIKGWDEGLLLVNEGAQATFLIPSDLAYSVQGQGDDIKPFSTLIFDIELVKIKPAKR